MKRPDATGWVEIGGTSAYACYEVRPDLMVMVPRQGMRDTAETARESLAFQDAWWREKGHTGCVAIYVDDVLDQDVEARQVYAHETEDALTHGLALIGGTFFGRALATAFMRLRRYAIPIGAFATLDAAMPWIEDVNRKHRRPL